MQRQRQPSPEHLDELDHVPLFDLSILRLGPVRGWSAIFPNMAAVRKAFAAFKPELTAMCDKSDPDTRHGHEPGCRYWCQWVIELLPSDPRRSVNGTDDTTTEPPCGEPWSCDRFEPSITYLHRRRLLKPGELEAIRREHSLQDIEAKIEFQRNQVLEKYRTDVEPLFRAEHEALNLILGRENSHAYC